MRSRPFPLSDIIEYWYLTALVLFANTVLVTAILTMAPRYMTSSTIPMALISSLFSYLVLIRGLMQSRKRRPPRPLTRWVKAASTAVGTALGVAILLAGALVGSSCATLWLVTEFG